MSDSRRVCAVCNHPYPALPHGRADHVDCSRAEHHGADPISVEDARRFLDRRGLLRDEDATSRVARFRSRPIPPTTRD